MLEMIPTVSRIIMGIMGFLTHFERTYLSTIFVNAQNSAARSENNIQYILSYCIVSFNIFILFFRIILNIYILFHSTNYHGTPKNQKNQVQQLIYFSRIERKEESEELRIKNIELEDKVKLRTEEYKKLSYDLAEDLVIIKQ